MSIQGNSIIIKPATQSSTLSIKNVELPTGDITIFIEAETITPPDANSDLVPRFIYASLSNLPDYEPEKKTKEFSPEPMVSSPRKEWKLILFQKADKKKKKKIFFFYDKKARNSYRFTP